MGPEGSNLKISEQGQDFFALENNGYMRQGFFVDIGAADGVTASNTFILEKFYKWKGIAVEPNPVFMQSLFNARDCVASTLCVYGETGKILPFKFCIDDDQFFGWNFRSGLVKHVDNIDEEVNKSFTEMNVLTITLGDLLKLYNAPKDINYISIDVEGAEYSILKSFDFSTYNIKCLTIEHSHSKDRYLIQRLMLDNGYTIFRQDQTGNEDWFVKK